MRISKVRVRGFRSLADVELDFESYDVFIGANGSGKSSTLYALDWFFNGGSLAESDVHGYREGSPLPEEARIEVSVTFTDLTDKDRERLKQYGRGEIAEIRRTWYPSTNSTKTVGNSRQGDGFAEVRAMSRVGDFRPAYATLRQRYTSLPDLGGSPSKDDIHDALGAWELHPDHQEHLVEVSDDDANQMMGWNGANVLRLCMRFVLVPAATSITTQIGENGKGSALNELVGALMSSASAKAQSEWLTKHSEVLDELTRDIRASVETSTGIQTARINERLSSLVPNASVTLTPSVPAWTPKADPSIATSVTVDGISNDVARQGHGVQRAVMISMFQALVPDEELTRTTHAPSDGETEEEAASRLTESIAGLPSLVIAIEEPEIYQHPIRARTFARTLSELSEHPNVQVLLASHSPYFVRPEQFSALHRFTLDRGASKTSHGSAGEIASRSGIALDQVEKAILANLPTEFSEGFFADAVVLAEGRTDQVVLNAVARRLGHDLDSLGIAIQAVEGKTGLPVAKAILEALGVPVYMLADGDAMGAARRYPNDQEKQKQAESSHRAQTDKIIDTLPPATAKAGSVPYAFGNASVVTDRYTIWLDDVEEELLAWPSFESALQAAGVNLAARSNKNLLAYGNAVDAANLDEVPEVIRFAVEAMVAIRGN